MFTSFCPLMELHWRRSIQHFFLWSSFPTFILNRCRGTSASLSINRRQGYAPAQGFESWQIVLETIMLPLHHTGKYCGRSKIRTCTTSSSDRHSTIELFIHLFDTDFLIDLLFLHYRIHLFSNNFVF